MGAVLNAPCVKRSSPAVEIARSKEVLKGADIIMPQSEQANSMEPP